MKQIIYALTTVLVSLPMVVFASSDKSMSKAALLLELTGKDISKENAASLYAEIVGAFQADEEVGLKSRVQNLLSRFPKSEYADNALYLAGRMDMDHHNYAEALKNFSKLLQDYPNGNKAVSAEFAKGIVYKKMNLEKLSKSILNEVKRKYPGSPESFRAESELRLMN